MCCSRAKRWLACPLLLAFAAQAGAEHVLSLGLEADTEDSEAFSLAGSFSANGDTWFTGSLAQSRSDGLPFDAETVLVDLGVDHHFDPVGVRLGGGYWGDSDLLDSTDLRAAVYWRNDDVSLSLDFERRAFDVTIRGPRGALRRFDLDADGIGLSARAALIDSVSVYANGMSYDYSRNISLDPDADFLRVFALSRISMVNSLVEERLRAGVEFEIGTRVVDLGYSSWKTAVFGDRVDSFGVGFLTPLGAASDIELRLSSDDSDTVGQATTFSVFLYFYGD